MSKSPSSSGRAGSETILAHPGPNTQDFRLTWWPCLWNGGLDDGGQPARSMRPRVEQRPWRRQAVWQRREGGAGHFLPDVSWAATPQVEDQWADCRLMPSSWKLGSAVGTPLPSVFSPAPQPSLVPVLRGAPSCHAFPFFLPPPNRLRQQDGTNLWLNSPKITKRSIKGSFCVKLTGVCTLLSNALGSRGGLATPSQPHHSPSTNPAPPPAWPWVKLPGRPQRK